MPQVMGIVNVTPDSFSDGGRFLDPERAVEHALRLVEEGADVLDLGAESTRPGGGVYGEGQEKVPAQEEIDRLLPVLEALRPRTELPISVDTRKGPVARAALEAGADWINDVGGLVDEDLRRVVAEAGCPVVLMHSRGDLATMQKDISFDDVVSEVRDELEERLRVAEDSGIERRRIILDPGLGFGKTAEQNLRLIRGLPVLTGLGLPILVGASRKSFLAAASGEPGSEPADRLASSLAAAAWSARLGARIVRVHDVGETVRFLRTWCAIGGSLEESPERAPAEPREAPVVRPADTIDSSP